MSCIRNISMKCTCIATDSIDCSKTHCDWPNCFNPVTPKGACCAVCPPDQGTNELLFQLYLLSTGNFKGLVELDIL